MSKKNTLEQLKGQHVVIVGDVMIDRYLIGSVSRISPEAPVPVVLSQSIQDRLGGAANVALNIQALGGVPLLCGVVGQDADGQLFHHQLLAQNNIANVGMIQSEARRTTVKTRILGNHQQMLRIDSEDTHDLDEQEAQTLIRQVSQVLQQFPVTAMILQDYNKGVLTQTVIRELIKLAKQHQVFIAVDPKKANFFEYVGVDLFKPNLKEIRESTPFPITTDLESLENAAIFLKKKIKNKYTMLTLSEKGLFLMGKQKGRLYPTTARHISDVSGAGDTVISIATMALAAGFDLPMVARLSNLAGGQVCESPGVVPVDLSKLQQELQANTRE